MVHFNVPGMTCGGCAERIRRAIAQARLPAGVDVAIDVAARQVRIPARADDGTVELVRCAIERAGYQAETAVATASRGTRGSCCCATRSITSADMNQGAAGHASSCCR